MQTPEPRNAPLIGAVLARRFRLVRLLGEGGMGVVYAADVLTPPGATPRPGEPARVAVKLLRPEFHADLEVLTRFLEEGRTCQRLIHPNILRVFECGQAEDGSPFLVMELLEGVPLSAYTANGGRVPPQQAIPILQGILAGLAAAHAQGVVHRDLKPENVFLAREPTGQFQVKLLDFGIAKVMDVAGGMGSRTKTGMLLGTPAYMSPEQIKSSKDVDLRSDLWSAGVMGYEMLSGRVAFPAPTEYARLAAVLNTEPEPLDRIEPALASVAPLIARAMQKDPASRFASALEMARALAPGGSEPPRVSPSYAPPREPMVTPLSRLPEVASLFAPPSGPSPAASSETHTRIAPPAAPPEPSPPKPAGTGTTLASAVGRPSGDVSPATQLMISASGTTMPSKDLPMFEAVASGKPRLGRAVSPKLVAFIAGLVVVALALGFLAGLLAGRALGASP